jgi:hypothetical protein
VDLQNHNTTQQSNCKKAPALAFSFLQIGSITDRKRTKKVKAPDEASNEILRQ